MMKYSSFTGLTLLAGVLFLISCSAKSDSAGMRNQARIIPAVEAVQVQYGSLPLTERLSGVVKARNLVEIYPEINAFVVDVYAENADYVKQGQPLVKLRDREFQERLRQAQASLQIAIAQAKQAKAELDETNSQLTRMKTLSEKGLASDTELENAQTRAVSLEANYELAQARIKQAQATADEREATLSQTIIRAPVSGTVGNRNAEIGMLVSGGTRLFTLGQLDSVRIEVVLTDKMLNYIKEGQRAEIGTEDNTNDPLSAPISRITPFLHPITHSTTGEIDLLNPDNRLKSGMFVTVDVFYGESDQAPLIPMSAIYENPSTGVTGVYVCQSDLNQEPVGNTGNGQSLALTEPAPFKFVPIDVIAKGQMSAGVRGVNPGDWVITLGQDMMGSDSGNARVRQVTWRWVEELQHLQRQDLLQELLGPEQAVGSDSVAVDHNMRTSS